MRRWAVAGHDVAIGVAAHELHPGQVDEQFEGRDRLDADCDEVAEHPPGFDTLAHTVGDDCFERDPVAVHIRDESQAHG